MVRLALRDFAGRLILVLVTLLARNAAGQIVAQAPGPALAMTAPSAPLTQSSEAMCVRKLGSTSSTLIMVADLGEFSGTGQSLLSCAL